MTTAQDQQSRAEFEAFWRKEMNVQVMDLARTNYPMTPPEKQQYLCHETNRAWMTWQAARALPPPENVREGEPYDNPAFEDLARTMGVWGTAQAALCAQFFLAGHGAQVAPLTDERIRQLDDATNFHESHTWSIRFARAIEAELRKKVTP